MRTLMVNSFEQWRERAREMICAAVPPNSVQFVEQNRQRSLFEDSESTSASVSTDSVGNEATHSDSKHSDSKPSDSKDSDSKHSDSNKSQFSVSKRFMELAGAVACHRDSQRWNLLYQALWRLTQGEAHLLQLATDDLVHQLGVMEKQVRRDSHKMKAFVRFREVVDPSGLEHESHFIAWHRPDHRILKRVAPFFSRRFNGMKWTILTPDESVHWDLHQLKYGPGVPKSEAPAADELEDLWKTYYGSTFNPARVKIKMMKSEMPVRYWDTMPETAIIEQLLNDAPQRVREMIARQEGYQRTASQFIDNHETQAPSFKNLEQLKQLASACTACDLYRDATQTVFGVGPQHATLVLLGEQPGNQEDLAGVPFIGPAGEVLNQAFSAAGIIREEIYLTNAVKHFKHTTVQSKNKVEPPRRLHAKPQAREIRCCRPWFDAEWSLLANAKVLVCLGSTASSVAFGPQFSLTQKRGEVLQSNYCNQTIATWHPSAILRTLDPAAQAIKRQQLISDLHSAQLLSADG